MAPTSNDPRTNESRADEKRAAAVCAVETVASGMAVGLGTGSTARFVAEEIASRIRDGRLKDVRCVPTSSHTESLAGSLGIPLITLDACPNLDLAIDGADEVDPRLDLIKGAGGALLREKIVATAAKRFVVVVDESKLVRSLGETAAVPVEVIPFGWRTHLRAIEELGGEPELRRSPDGQPYLTDEGNYIVDTRWAGIDDAVATNRALRRRPGIVETGFFLSMADTVLVGGAKGVRTLARV